MILFVVSGGCGFRGFGLMVGLWLLLLSLSVWLVDAGFMLGDCTVVLDCCFVCFVVLRGFLRFANFMLMVVRFCGCLFGWLFLVAGYACWQGLRVLHNLVVWLLVWVFCFGRVCMVRLGSITLLGFGRGCCLGLASGLLLLSVFGFPISVGWLRLLDW